MEDRMSDLFTAGNGSVWLPLVVIVSFGTRNQLSERICAIATNEKVLNEPNFFPVTACLTKLQ